MQLTQFKIINYNVLIYLEWKCNIRNIIYTLRAFKSAVKIFICTASCRVALACRMHSEKCSSIWSLCLKATTGNTKPNRTTDMSITATPKGNGSGTLSP